MNPNGRPPKPISQRFWPNVNKDGPEHPVHGKCWVWVASILTSGYGLFWTGKKMERVHRVSWKIHFGDIPAGLSVLHKCDNPACVNPDHLFLGTVQDNSDDMVAKGRQTKGEKNGRAILTDEIVIQARRDYKSHSKTRGCKALARRFGVPSHLLLAAILGYTWKHLNVVASPR